MIYFMNPKRLFSTIWCLFLFVSLAYGQSFRFRNYDREKLPSTEIHSIVQAENGFLYISTSAGLVKFDGYDFDRIIFPDSVSGRYSDATLKDKNGNLWFGCNDGTLFYTNNNNLVRIPQINVQNINSILESPDGFIWVIPQDEMIFRINENNPKEVSRFYISSEVGKTSFFDSFSMTSACLAPGGKLIIGTNQNLLYCNIINDSVKLISSVSKEEKKWIQSIKPLPSEGKYIVGIREGGIFNLEIINDKPVLKRFPEHLEFESVNPKTIYIDHAGIVWVPASGSGLYKITLSPDYSRIEGSVLYDTRLGLAGNEVLTVFQDKEQDIWIGIFDKGLSVLTSDGFNFYTPSDKPDASNIIYEKQLDNKYFLGTPKGYYIFDINKGKAETFIDLSMIAERTEILSYLLDDSNRLWIGTKGGGLYLKNLYGGITQFFRSGNSGEDFVKHIASDNKNLWLSTIEGLIIIDINTGVVRKKYKMGEGLPYNSINQIFFKRNGNALVATDCDRLYEINTDKEVKIGEGILYGSNNRITCFAEGANNEIWAGTSRNGIFFIRNDSVTRITTENGLLTNYCRSILADSDNKIWIGHERGISRYDINTGTIKVYNNDFAKGGDSNPLAIYETSDHKILIGTTEGLIVYDRKQDKIIPSAPITNIKTVTINEKTYPYQPSYSLPHKRNYTIRINYVGINLTNPEKVSYRTMMEPINENWSRITFSREISYTPAEGRYKFHVISLSEDGLSQESPASFELLIKKPFWRTWWFSLLAITIISAIVAVIIYLREKTQREIKEYLEKELAERTRLVLKQKDEIELQNIEITDSINYAKRIQSSILPDVNKLRDTFRDAFIIFHPRDIVSGDFYWFDKIDEERFVIVCADSTGHGVPGAFMSMIGSTLLQDIVSRKGITKPSQVLKLLDKQIFSTLNQNIDVGVSNDGMDMVVCEFNVKTRHIRFASAMRPVIIVLEGESFYIRGNRCSVGGESVVEKFFDDQEYYLAKGDTVYMFSDGLPDQFGGVDGKKMKIARLKKLIEEVCHLPMVEQKAIISNFYFDWKGDYEQVDDI
jgi:ligand-binding sensor domain-containing protein/serine phosphatase RsbU (regulator of sigma subunit)